MDTEASSAEPRSLMTPTFSFTRKETHSMTVLLRSAIITALLVASAYLPRTAGASELGAAPPIPGQTNKLTWTGDSSQGQNGQLPAAGIMLGNGYNFKPATYLSVCVQGAPGSSLNFQVADGQSPRFGPANGRNVTIPADGKYAGGYWLGVEYGNEYDGAPFIYFQQSDAAGGHSGTTPGQKTVTITQGWVSNPCA